jgi:hypothetical protein
VGSPPEYHRQGPPPGDHTWDIILGGPPLRNPPSCMSLADPFWVTNSCTPPMRENIEGPVLEPQLETTFRGHACLTPLWGLRSGRPFSGFWDPPCGKHFLSPLGGCPPVTPLVTPLLLSSLWRLLRGFCLLEPDWGNPLRKPLRGPPLRDHLGGHPCCYPPWGHPCVTNLGPPLWDLRWVTPLV